MFGRLPRSWIVVLALLHTMIWLGESWTTDQQVRQQQEQEQEQQQYDNENDENNILQHQRQIANDGDNDNHNDNRNDIDIDIHIDDNDDLDATVFGDWRVVELHRRPSTTNGCNFTKELVLGNPMSLDPIKDRFYDISFMIQKAYELMIMYLNSPKYCGIDIDGDRYSLALKTYGDGSDKDQTIEVTNLLLNDPFVNFVLGGYKSSLTRPITPLFEENSRLFVSAGASSPDVFENKDWSFGTLANSEFKFDTVLELLSNVGATSIAVLKEQHIASCTNVLSKAQSLDFVGPNGSNDETDIIIQLPVVEDNDDDDDSSSSSSSTFLLDVLQEMYKDNDKNDDNGGPDVLAFCTEANVCTEALQILKDLDINPSAIVCLLMEDDLDPIYKQYSLFVESWFPNKPKTTDAITGWTAQEFSEHFTKYTSRVPTYHGPAGAAAISALIQAIERTGSIDQQVVRDELARTDAFFPTSYHNITFDENGQANIPFSVLQFVDTYNDVTNLLFETDTDGSSGSTTTTNTGIVGDSRNVDVSSVIVAPEGDKTGEIVYPMPTWKQRECKQGGFCEGIRQNNGLIGGICMSDGTCDCSTPTAAQLGLQSAGHGFNATCIEVIDNPNIIPMGIIGFGYAIVGACWVLAVYFLTWTYRHRRETFLKVSQVEFLYCICIGAMISSSTLIALSYDDSRSSELTATRACRAVPFLYTIGWCLVYSSLSAKTYRLYKIMKNNERGEQEVVSFCSMFKFVLVLMCVDLLIVLAWTFTNPLMYVRVPISRFVDLENGVIRTESTGYCYTEEENPNLWSFLGPLVGIHLCCLIATNLMLLKVRKMSDRYQESRHIGMAMVLMLEVFAVGVPIAVASSDNASAIYAVLIGTIGLHDIGILCFMFIPKITMQQEGKQGDAKSDSIMLASLRRADTNQWDQSLNVINEILEEGSPVSEVMTSHQIEQLTMAKTLLIQGVQGGREKKMMYIPSNLLLNINDGRRKVLNSLKKSISPVDSTVRFILSEYGGVNMQHHHTYPTDDETESSLENGKKEFLFPRAAAFYCLPEFEKMSRSRQVSLLKLLSWSNLKRWDFDIFKLHEFTDGQPLLFVGWAILGSPYSQNTMARICHQEEIEVDDFDGYDFMNTELRVPLKKLCDYLRVIEADYNANNPFHNQIHGADVLQTTHCLIQMTENSFDSSIEDLFSILLAAAVHDVKHPGTTNDFQKNARTGLGIFYNDVSVLENLHASHAFKKMLGCDPNDLELTERNNDVNPLCNLSPKRFLTVRKNIVDAVLHTDMAKHFETMSAIDAQVKLKVTDEEKVADQRWQFLMYIMHLADISNPTKHSPLNKKWAERCMEEFFAQGDLEKEMGLPVGWDRDLTDTPSAQIGFIKFCIKPAFVILGKIIPEVQTRVLPVIESNISGWEKSKSEGG